MVVRAVIACVLAMLLLPPPAAAHALTWRQVAFAGARVHALAAADNGRVLYLSTDLGLQVSDDGGEIWHYAGMDLDARSAPDVVALAVDPRDPATAYAGTAPGEGAGLFVTRDMGRRWERVFAGRRGDGVVLLEVSPQEPDYVLAVASTGAGRDDEVIGSEDGGRTWAVLLPEGDGYARHYHAVAHLPARPYPILVASSHGGLVAVVNGGGRWWSSGSPEDAMYGLVADFPRRGWIYAAGQRDLFLSRDEGSAWQRARTPWIGVCESFARDGLIVSGGEAPVLLATTYSMCPGEPGRIYARLPAGGGNSAWREADDGLPRAERIGLVAEGGHAYALTPDGLWVAELPVVLASEPVAPPAEAGTESSTGINIAAPEPYNPPTQADEEASPPGSDADPTRPDGDRTLAVVLVSVAGVGAVGALALTRRFRRPKPDEEARQ